MKLGIDVPHIYTKMPGEKSNLFLEYRLNRGGNDGIGDWTLSLNSPHEKFALLVKKDLFNEFGYKDVNVGSAYYKLHIGERKSNENNVINSVEEQRKMKKKNIATIAIDSFPLDKLYDFVKTQKNSLPQVTTRAF